MGVRGFRKLLQREGWLPDDTKIPCCSTSLWRDASVMHECPRFAARVGIVPKRSTLCIDGAGLCFELYRTAYARHTADVLGKVGTGGSRRRSSSSSSSCPSSRKLKPGQATELLPNLLPLRRLDEVTREFVHTLQKKHHMTLKIYFDGNLRRDAKRATDEERRQRRPSEWSALQQYCCNGVMPTVDKVCQWDKEFPKNGLFIEQIKHTLGVLQVEVVVCQEEADAVLASMSSQPNSYVVGNDTDFCFFRNAKYIPLKTLHASDSVATAVVLSRETLAETLQLPDPEAMVELAILMRNDYVSSQDKLDFNRLETDSILVHLRSSGKGYRVEAANEDAQQGIRFVRTLYNLGNLDDEFPLSPKHSKSLEFSDDCDQYTGPVLKVPNDFPDHLAELQAGDTSLKGAVLRCLRSYIDSPEKPEEGKCMIQQEHLDGFKQMSSHQAHVIHDDWKPRWEDVLAAYLIESCIRYVRKRSGQNSHLVRLTPPEKIFDEYLFHSTMQKIRHSSVATDQQNDALPTQKKNTPLTSPTNGSPDRNKLEPRPKLPVDEHEENILKAINQNRVTIIQGETGCGKSSRVPIMIMNSPPPQPLTHVKLFISQPRRIAAKSLVERLRKTEPKLGKAIALRMGHGVREYENSGTMAWFVTTGYLVRLLANHPENFDKVSHLIIDEVHERSVDTDILCLLCRRLLLSNPHIRLVLMSATLAAKLYQDYFNIAEPPIKVGARRFPIEEIFVEEIPNNLQLPPKEAKAANQIEECCRRTMCIAPPSNAVMESIYNLAARIAITVGRPGSSVLIFVPGMNDIVAISEKIEAIYVPGTVFTIIPIHSDIPFEDQMTVFDELQEEVKIIIATNAAESSLTLPDCDHVIDTGLNKKITYNVTSHRRILLACWISRASAQQRSGRVGRVRPGHVYRLYSRDAYESMMCEFESGEMLRMPLDSVILMLKEMLNEETTPALMSCIEPPDISNVDRSYKSLFKANFISQPDDSGDITVLGAFAVALGIDLTLGALIGLGIQFGVGAEAIEMAAVLSYPQTPWLLSNPLVHKPNQFNSGSVKTYVSRNRFDAGLYSEPLATMNLMHEFSQLNESRLSTFCNHHGVHLTRIKRLISTRDSILSRVAEFVKIDPGLLKAPAPPARMPHSKVTMLRILQVWVFCDTIIEHKPLSIKPSADGSVSIAVKSSIEIKEAHLDKLFRGDRHPYTLCSNTEVEQTGGFIPFEGEAFELMEFLTGFEQRFLSFVIEKEFNLAWFWFEHEIRIYTAREQFRPSEFEKLRHKLDGIAEETIVQMTEASSGRGRAERASGRWTITETSDEEDVSSGRRVLVQRVIVRDASIIDGINTSLRSILRKASKYKMGISFDFSKNGKKKKKNRVNPVCQISCLGTQRFRLSDADFCDLLAIPKLEEHYWLLDKREVRNQAIRFDDVRSPYVEVPRNTESSLHESDDSSWKRPLLPKNIPESVRLLGVMASARRKENNIQITMTKTDDADIDEDELVSFSLDHCFSRISQRWTRLNTNNAVFVYENSVPASVIPVDSPGALYACCANTLDLRGGALKAEGLTLLPPGTYFLLLSLLAFGMTPDGFGAFCHTHDCLSPNNEDDSIEEFVQFCLNWVEQKDLSDSTQERKQESDIDWSSRIRGAIDFAKSCSDLGERLVCFPEKVRAICQLFDRVDGYPSAVWASLDSNPFTAENRRKHRELVRLTEGASRPGVSYQDSTRPESEGIPVKLSSLGSSHEIVQEGGKSENSEGVLIGVELQTFPDEIKLKSQQLFAPELLSDEDFDQNEMPTTNILSLCVRHLFSGLTCAALLQPDLRYELLNLLKKRRIVHFTDDFWRLHRFVDQDGKDWFRAIFIDANLPLKIRNTEGLAKWIKYERPYTMEDATTCCPPGFRDVHIFEAEIFEPDNVKRKAVLFESIEIALRMEAAFVLERSFCTRKEHWYDFGPDLMQLVAQRTPSVGQLLQAFQGHFNFSISPT